MKLLTYLNYGGNCAEAFRFYEEHLGRKIATLVRHGEQPGGESTPAELKNTVLHARLTLGGTELLGSDVAPSRYQPMRSAYLSLAVDSDAEAERIYGVLSEGAELFMPLGTTFFASRFAMLRDKFGTSWMILREVARG